VMKRFSAIKMKGKDRCYETVEELKAEMQFRALFLLSDAVNIELNLQYFLDLAASKRGFLCSSGPEQR